MQSGNEEASEDPAKAADAVSRKYHHEALVSEMNSAHNIAME